MRDFTKYDIWQVSHQLTLTIYEITSKFPKSEVYNLTSQIRRACASIPTNIAEGCGRSSDKEFNQFLNIALGSTSETEYLMILSKDLNILSEEDFNHLNETINHIKRKIFKLKERLTPL